MMRNLCFLGGLQKTGQRRVRRTSVNRFPRRLGCAWRTRCGERRRLCGRRYGGACATMRIGCGQTFNRPKQSQPQSLFFLASAIVAGPASWS